jgi:hypothetical protein
MLPKRRAPALFAREVELRRSLKEEEKSTRPGSSCGTALFPDLGDCDAVMLAHVSTPERFVLRVTAH